MSWRGSAADGYRISVFAAELPMDIEGGERDTHVLVTVYAPYKTTYVLPRVEVYDVYLMEKVGNTAFSDALNRELFTTIRAAIKDIT